MLIVIAQTVWLLPELADRIVFMHAGKIWEAGPTRELLERPRTPELEQFLGSVLS